MKRLIVLLAGALLLSGCTTIPTSSSPQVVRTLASPPRTSPAKVNGPQRGEGPDKVVSGFVNAGADADAGHSTARQFLSANAARRWQDNPTVILDETNIGDAVFSGDGSATVPVTGRRVGQLDAGGVFTPTLKGTGTGDQETFNFSLTKTGGEWRIDQLQPGVLISATTFDSDYAARRLYFFDSSQRILVPDLRYSPLQGQALASWLLTQLQAGPRAELAQSVVSDLPDQAGKSSVVIGNPMIVDIPGTGQLSSPSQNAVSALNGLAAQLAWTLSQVTYDNGQLRLTDSGKPVQVPGTQGLNFSNANFSAVGPTDATAGAELYFLRAGSVFSGTGSPLSGLSGPGSHNLNSVAIRRNGGQALLVAGFTAGGQFLIGDEQRLTPVPLRQDATSRPDWRPYPADDVWFGAGSHGGIYRVTTGQPVNTVSITSQLGGLPPGPVTALRLSPDGERIALVLRGANGAGSVWIGSVVTSGADVRIDSLEPVTPPALSVTDLAWADPTRLLLVAASPGAAPLVWQVYSDGSKLSQLTYPGLPGPPTAVTAAGGQPPVVSAGGAIWVLKDGTWINPASTGLQLAGTNPVYAP